MYGTAMLDCCNTPEALLVMAALPVCDMVQSAKTLCHDSPLAFCDLGDPPVSQCVFPLRCAAVMDCGSVLDLMEGVGDVVF